MEYETAGGLPLDSEELEQLCCERAAGLVPAREKKRDPVVAPTSLMPPSGRAMLKKAPSPPGILQLHENFYQGFYIGRPLGWIGVEEQTANEIN